LAGPFFGKLQTVDLGVVANVYGKGMLEDDVLHAIGLGIDTGEVA
jgi:hypothetical protein